MYIAPAIAADNALMHDSMSRLLECAQAATAALPAGLRVGEVGDLRKHFDWSHQQITNWKSRGLSRDAALAAEAKFGCSANWLLVGTGRAWPKPQHSVAGEAPAIYGVAHNVSHAKIQIAPIHIAWELLMTDQLPAEFQTQMPDASMEPDIPVGATIIFVRDAAPVPGDFVLVQDSAQTLYVREYRSARPGHWTAVATNSSYLPLDPIADHLKVVAVFDGMRGRRGRY